VSPMRCKIDLCCTFAIYSQYIRRMENAIESSKTAKTATLTFRVAPAVKEALRLAAGHEHRSIANMVEVMIRDYCVRNGFAVPDHASKPASNL
jgi:hypothetical protein